MMDNTTNQTTNTKTMAMPNDGDASTSTVIFPSPSTTGTEATIGVEDAIMSDVNIPTATADPIQRHLKDASAIKNNHHYYQ